MLILCPSRDSQGGRIDSPNSNLVIQRGIGSGVPSNPSEQVPRVLPANREPTTTVPSAELPPRSPRVPSIVARLQQVHGLTKKKLYGTINHLPPPVPFFKDERTNTRSQRASLQPPMAREVQEYVGHNNLPSNSGGRAQTKSREGRKNRLAQRNATSPPRAARKGKRSDSSPLSSNNPTPSVSPSSPTRNPAYSAHGHTGVAAVASSVGSCDSAQDRDGHQTPDPVAPSTHLPQGPQPMSSNISALNADNLPYTTQTEMPDFSGTYVAFNNSALTLAVTSPSPRLREQGVSYSEAQTIQSRADYSWNLPHRSLAQANPFPWGRPEEMIVPSHLISAYGEVNGPNSTPESVSTSPEMVPYISSEHFYSNHPEFGAEYGSYGSVVGPEWSPAATTVSTTSCGSDASVNILGTTPQAFGFTYDSTAEPLPQFYHSSSSSLSAMINPRLDTDSSGTNPKR